MTQVVEHAPPTRAPPTHAHARERTHTVILSKGLLLLLLLLSLLLLLPSDENAEFL